jgi:uncharacterized Zn finger protein
MGYGRDGFGWTPYVSVGQKLARAKKRALQVAKKQKREPSPVEVKGRTIATSFWGKAWCDNLKAYSDFSNRLPRGATYVRNGSVADLVIRAGSIEAIVAGSEPYTVSITIDKLAKATWNKIKQNCSSSIDSLFDLLAGRLSNGVMQGLTDKKDGCFPSPREINMKCSCPDYSYCCKHIAAVMYGVGNRLDKQPELLFLLRGVDHAELVSAAVSKDNLDRELASSNGSGIAESDLSELFGIELESGTISGQPSRSTTSKPSSRKGRASQKSGSRSNKSGVAKAELVTPELSKPELAKVGLSNAAVKGAAVKSVAVKNSAVKNARLAANAVVAKAVATKAGLAKESNPPQVAESNTKTKSPNIGRKPHGKHAASKSDPSKQIANGLAGGNTKQQSKKRNAADSTAKAGKGAATMTKKSSATKSSIKSVVNKIRA